MSNLAVVYTTNQEPDAQLLQGCLEDKDIPCSVDSRKDPFGLLAEFNVLVPFDYVLGAEEVLKGVEEQQFVEKAEEAEEVSEGSEEQQFSEKAEFPEVRPWARCWARYVDIVLGSFLILALTTIFAPALFLLDPPDILIVWVVVFLWVFAEASLLSTWGTTPGKWLLRITLRDSAGQNVTYSRALKRSFSVWFAGLGLGVPVFAFITLFFARQELKNEGITTWDCEGSFVVSHERISSLRLIVTTLISIIPIALVLLGMSLEE